MNDVARPGLQRSRSNRMIGGVCGGLAEWLGWVPYFGLTTVAALPGLVLLAILVRRGWTGLEGPPAPVG